MLDEGDGDRAKMGNFDSLIWPCIWQMECDDSPWYPSMRLFRQASPNDCKGTVERVCEALCDWSVNSRN